jgi:hypothetical protein
MKAPLCSALLIASLALASFAGDRETELKIHADCIPFPARHALMLSLSNTGDTPVALAPQVIVSRLDSPAGKPPVDAADVVHVSVEFVVNAGAQAPAALPAPFSAGVGQDPVKIDPGKYNRPNIPLGDDLLAYAKTPGVTTCYRVRYHGRLLAEVACNDKGQIISRLEPWRGILTTYTYDDTGKRNGQQISVPNDPELRASLAAKEKELLQRLQDAGNNERMKDGVLHDMIIFYTSQSLEFDKAANLQFALREPVEIYNLKLFLAINATKSDKEMNEKLEELIQLFPDKKKYTENFIRK